MNTSIISIHLTQNFGFSPILPASSSYELRKVSLFKSFSPLYRASGRIHADSLISHSILNSVVYLEQASFTGVSFVFQINKPTASITFKHCSFISTATGSSQGSAVYSSTSYTLQFFGCVFVNCSSTTYPSAAAIYCAGPIFITCCSFDRCILAYQSSETEQITNVIYSSGTSFNCSFSIFTRSAESNTGGADSTFCTFNSFVCVNSINCTLDYGNYGSASGRFYGVTSGSSIEYVTVFHCGEYDSIEFWYTNYASVSFFSVANSTEFTGGLLYFNTVTSVISNMTVYGCSFPTFIYSANSYTCTFVNCVADFAQSSLTFSSHPITYDVGSQISKECSGSFKFTSVIGSLTSSSIYPIICVAIPLFS